MHDPRLSLGTISRAALAVALVVGLGAAATHAAPVASSAGAISARANLPIELAADGCGPGFFRTLAGQCFPNRVYVGPYGGIHAPPPCPRGYLRAPDRPICYPVR